MKCKGVYTYICVNLDADMNSPKCREIRRHLRTCPDCSAYLDSLKKTVLLYKRQPGPRVPLHARKRLHRMIDATLRKASAGKPATR